MSEHHRKNSLSSAFEWAEAHLQNQGVSTACTAPHLPSAASARRLAAWPARARPPADRGGWELLHNEAAEACEGTYDACAIFAGKTQAEVAKAWPHEAGAWPPEGAGSWRSSFGA